jgi:hypothetical protein
VTTYGFDGVYLDGRMRDVLLQEVAQTDLANVTTFDCNGDGQADTIDQLVIQYSSWAPVLTHTLRSCHDLQPTRF